MNDSRSVLFITNCEYGQANVHLAVAYELLLEGLRVHVCSFPPLEDRVLRLQSLANKSHPRVGRITFHGITGPSMVESLDVKYGPIPELIHGPGVGNAIRSYPFFCKAVCAWTCSQYTRMYVELRALLEELDPSTVVVDSLFNVGIDACRGLKREHVVLSPNTVKDLFVTLQPRLAFLWKYPAHSTHVEESLAWKVNFQSLICTPNAAITSLLQLMGSTSRLWRRQESHFVAPSSDRSYRAFPKTTQIWMLG
ncbi:hypothetical protein LTR56_019894 [Elasticomyces elasticus]|nr:hypothetical protein LTR56_019894 [Elasticomyces elasticus]KAK4914422.1 hypothetical protein LTR49_017342 [Elasticomyces elasticus]KAK5760398.1 hypothetical protein LTS12_009442 [Elasticomyces elasticus]